MAFLGCSRGFGRAVCVEFDQQDVLKNALLVARHSGNLEKLSQVLKVQSQMMSFDFSNPSILDSLLFELKKLQPKRIFYFAGGGCYGNFASKKWKDHLWGLQVTFLTPTRLLHSCLSDSGLDCVEQIIFVGSQVADDQADPRASSYSAGKHALKGLIESILLEGCSKDLRLFRPGYMDTDMLPAHCPPRQRGDLLTSPEDAARSFVAWALNPSGSSIYDF